MKHVFDHFLEQRESAPLSPLVVILFSSTVEAGRLAGWLDGPQTVSERLYLSSDQTSASRG